MTFGPPLGSYLFAKLGYDITFYVFAFANVIAFVICLFYVPNKINQIDEADDHTLETSLPIENLNLLEYDDIGYGMIFKNK